MKPADFLIKKTSGNFCNYLNTSFKNGTTLYNCKCPQGLLEGMDFTEPCTNDVWNSCPMNRNFSAEEIIKKSSQLPDDGESLEAMLPTEMQFYGIKWIIEKKDGNYSVYRIIIYPGTSLNKPPKIKTERIE